MIMFGLPEDQAVLASIGKVAIRHGQLDYVLRMTVKSIAGVTIAEALDATGGMTSGRLREQVLALARRRLRESPALLQLRALLTRSKRATARRNALLHGLWARELEGNDVYRSDGQSFGPIPPVSELDALADELYAVTVALNSARLDGFLRLALEETGRRGHRQ